MNNIKVKRFEHYQFTDRDVNKFLEENDAEYVDMKCTNDSIFLIYRDRKMVIIENLTKNIQKVKRGIN